jgi:hypothetical protein
MIPGLHPVADAPHPELFARIFKPGSFLRIENPAGFSQILEIRRASAAGATVDLVNAPVRAIGDQAQGVMLLGRGHRVNVLSYIDYRVVRSTGALGRDATDGRKSDLERRELGANGTAPVAGSERVLAEYVVDFQVGYLVDDEVAPTAPPRLRELTFDESAAWANPERIRGLKFRLSTRTREEDPQFPWSDPGDPLVRFKVDPRTESAARVRSIEGSMIVPGLAR